MSAGRASSTPNPNTATPNRSAGRPPHPSTSAWRCSANPASPLALYFDEVDQRFHLLGADYGYMDVDYNLDGVVDGAQTWKDTDGDGKLDVREIDVNNDGVVDDLYRP